MKDMEQHDLNWYLSRAEYLSQFMLAERYENMRRVAAMRTRYMTICMENTFHPQNASALVRNCEAFGVQDIHAVETVCGFRPNVNIVRGTDKWVDIHRYGSTGEAVEGLRQAGYRLVVTSPHKGGHTPESFDVERGKFCVVFGTEKDGVSGQIMEAADEFLVIPMCGFVESLNVSASAAILLQILTSRVRSSDVPWRLSEVEQAELLFRWAQESVKDAGSILEKFGQR